MWLNKLLFYLIFALTGVAKMFIKKDKLKWEKIFDVHLSMLIGPFKQIGAWGRQQVGVSHYETLWPVL
jgi:hypothetical protein